MSPIIRKQSRFSFFRTGTLGLKKMWSQAVVVGAVLAAVLLEDLLQLFRALLPVDLLLLPIDSAARADALVVQLDRRRGAERHSAVRAVGHLWWRRHSGNRREAPNCPAMPGDPAQPLIYRIVVHLRVFYLSAMELETSLIRLVRFDVLRRGSAGGKLARHVGISAAAVTTEGTLR